MDQTLEQICKDELKFTTVAEGVETGYSFLRSRADIMDIIVPKYPTILGEFHWQYGHQLVVFAMDTTDTQEGCEALAQKLLVCLALHYQAKQVEAENLGNFWAEALENF